MPKTPLPPPLLPAPPLRKGVLHPIALSVPSPEELGLVPTRCKARIPNDVACFALWDEYTMLPNIRKHSEAVAFIAEYLAKQAVRKQYLDHEAIAITRASALLHDIAKSYTLLHGGNHAQMGASWSLYANGHYGIAQAIANHIEWPWPYPKKISQTALFVLYADKRVQHDTIVTMAERYEDLLTRYGKTKASVSSLRYGWQRAIELERAIEVQLEIDICEYSFDSGRLVP